VRANAELARDVRRGMYVTAMYVLVDPKEGTAIVACAGHKMPLIRYAATDKKIRLIQPEGIALGLDKGTVFEQTLKITKMPIDPGDRIVIANTGPVGVKNEAGEELGEKAFYRHVLQHAGMPTEAMLEAVRTDLQTFAGKESFPSDISIVSLRRMA
jgi:serine phosphatase RsbU (regulator of sigma subunit)